MSEPEQKLRSLLKTEIDPAFKRRAQFIFNQTSTLQPHKILDIGCGRGFYTEALATLPYVKQIVGLDSSQEYIEAARRRKASNKITYLREDFNQWQSDQQFDLVILSEVLEHLPNDMKVLEKVKDLLKPDGKLIITVPHMNFPFFWDPLNFTLMRFGTHVRADWWWLAGIWADHQRLYTPASLETVAHQSGYQRIALEEQVHYCWPFTHFLLYGLGKNFVLKFNINSVNRFNDEKKPMASLLASFFELPEKLMSSHLGFLNSGKKKRSAGLATLYQPLQLN